MKIKLIRNKLALIPREGVRVERVEVASPLHRALLAAKIHEEAAEIANDPTDPKEYADLIECTMQLAQFNGISADTIYGTMLAKRKERGGFGHGYYMVTI